MKVTIDGITYDGTVEEIRDLVSNPPTRVSPPCYGTPSPHYLNPNEFDDVRESDFELGGIVCHKNQDLSTISNCPIY